MAIEESSWRVATDTGYTVDGKVRIDHKRTLQVACQEDNQ